MAKKINKKIIDVIQKYSEIINKTIKINSIYLFGSFAEGKENFDSDIDLALIVDDDILENKFLTEYEIMKKRREIDLRIEPHIFAKNDLDTPFAQFILKNGIKIL